MPELDPTTIPTTIPTAAVSQEAVRAAAADAVTREAQDRVAGGIGGPSPELARLLAALRASVVRYVHERRAAGTPVERIVPELKSLVREAATREQWRDAGDTLREQVVRWAIAAYYDRPEPAHVPRVD